MTGSGYSSLETSLLPRLGEAVGALLEVAPRARLAAAGLRYLDEIVMPDISSGPEEWGQWVRPELFVGVEALPGGRKRNFRTAYHVHEEDDPAVCVSFQCGTHWGVSVIGRGLPLFPKGGADRLAVVLDTDAHWDPDEDAPLAVDAVEGRIRSLHELVAKPFYWAITEQARSTFGLAKGDGV
jgi:uncharacterized protein (TIGR04255 family)